MPHNLFAHFSAGERSRNPREPCKCLSRAMQVLLTSRASVAREPYKCPTKALRHTPQQASGSSAVRAARKEQNRKTNIAPHYSPITEYFSYICLRQE